MASIFDKLFKRKPSPPSSPLPDQIITAPLSEAQIQSAISHQPPGDPPQFAVASAQSVGKQRDHNEDTLLTFTITIGNSTRNQPIGLFVIADGMGGYEHGEIASNSAMRAFSSYILRKFHPILSDPSNSMDESIQEILQSAVKEAQRSVTKAVPGSGTTLTAALALGDQMTIAHVGDSRAYTVFPDGRINQITRDHTLVRRLEELGQISPDEAAVHPHRNVLYRAIGQGELLEADVFSLPFPKQGYLLLCSDGLWGVVPDAEIARIISDSHNMHSACLNMVSAANAAGGPDNISAVLVQFLG